MESRTASQLNISSSKKSISQSQTEINAVNEDLGHVISQTVPVPVPQPEPEPVTAVPSTSREESDEVIRSPLDQRTYKPITLPNGVKVMLISTSDVEYFAHEQNATVPPCQVPEVADFNKMYLGYDNPAAKVKCGCPCDDRKGCCGGSRKEKEEAWKGGCCGSGNKEKAEPTPGPSTRDLDEPIITIEHVSEEDLANDDSNTGLDGETIVDADGNIDLKYNHAKKIKPGLRVKPKSKSRPFCQTCLCCGGRNMGNPKGAPDESLEWDRASAAAKELGKAKKGRLPSKHYPFPPKFAEGIHTTRACPAGGLGGVLPTPTRQPKTNRPHFNPESNLDLEGTVFLVVGSGYFDDPDDQPGLAHFCEHAVFLGSEKFPEPNQLFKLVLPYDGYVNAYTSGMSTTFTASASFKLFPLSVEILADMVGFPLFPNALVSAELEALDSEYSLRQDDTPKYFQLIGSLAKKGHVMRKMDSGNISTLTVPNFYRKLVEWRRVFYSPNRMTLALEAPFPVEYLETLVMETFGKIPPAHVAIPNWPIMPSCPFDMRRFHQIYHVPSVHHSEFLAIHWALEARAWKNLKVKPLEYLGAIISHKAEGGLAHYLTSQGLATNVDAGCWESDVTRNHYTSVFCISVDMTEKGFNKQDNILQAVFGYLQMIIREGPQKFFFNEFQKQQLEAFHYRAAESMLSLAESISRWMQFIPSKWCLISPTLTCQFDEQLIQKYTESLTVESSNIIIFSKNYRGGDRFGESGKEEFYNTPFASYNFPSELEEKLRNTRDDYSLKFTLPPPNPLLLETCCQRSAEKDLMTKGTLHKVKGKLTVSYISRNVQLVRGLLPQARYSIWIGSPVASYVGASEGSSTKMQIFSEYLNELFHTRFYHASNADLQLETEVSQGELHVILAGAHVMLPSLFEQVVDLFNNFESVADENGFEVVRSAFIEGLDNTILDNRFLAWDLYYYLWTNNHELIFDHRRHAERLTFANFLTFVTNFKSQMYIQAHMYGYVTNVQGESAKNALQKLKYEPIDLRQYLLLRCLRLPLGERIIKVNSQNPSIHTSVVINSYQFGMLTEPEEEAVNFFAKTMSDAAFYQLRTEQQLGYIIIIYAEVTFGVSSIIVELVTQPKNFTTEHCNMCIDNFLLDFFLQNLSSHDNFIDFSLGKPKLDLPFHMIQDLFQTYLLPNPFHYRKLSIQVVGTIEAGAEPPPNPGPQKIPHTAYPGYISGTDHDDVFTKVPHKTGLPDEDVNLRVSPSVGGSSVVEPLRTAKRSLQVRGGYKAFDTSARDPKKSVPGHGKSVEVCSRVIQDLQQFKKSLSHYPKHD